MPKKNRDEKLRQYDRCPNCKRLWDQIDLSKRTAKYYITKDHIVPLLECDTDNIDNIQPLCYQCNFRKESKIKGDN